jgi:hypothetical protein
MNTKLLTIITAIAFYSGAAYCSPQEDVAYLENQLQSIHANFEQNDSSNVAQEIAFNNINLLETYVIKGLNRNLAKLEKYKARLKQMQSDYSNEEDSSNSYNFRDSRLQKKIDAAEMKAKAYKEILFGIQVLKLRMAS